MKNVRESPRYQSEAFVQLLQIHSQPYLKKWWKLSSKGRTLCLQAKPRRTFGGYCQAWIKHTYQQTNYLSFNTDFINKTSCLVKFETPYTVYNCVFSILFELVPIHSYCSSVFDNFSWKLLIYMQHAPSSWWMCHLLQTLHAHRCILASPEATKSNVNENIYENIYANIYIYVNMSASHVFESMLYVRFTLYVHHICVR